MSNESMDSAKTSECKLMLQAYVETDRSGFSDKYSNYFLWTFSKEGEVIWDR